MCGHGIGRPRIAEPSGDARITASGNQDDRDAPGAPPGSGGEEREQHDAACTRTAAIFSQVVFAAVRTSARRMSRNSRP